MPHLSPKALHSKSNPSLKMLHSNSNPKVRASAAGLGNSTARMAAIVVPVLGGSLMRDASADAGMLLFGCVYVAGGVSVCCLQQHSAGSSEESSDHDGPTKVSVELMGIASDHCVDAKSSVACSADCAEEDTQTL